MNRKITTRISRLLAISLLVYNLGIAFHHHHIDICLNCDVKVTSPGHSHHTGSVSAADCPVILHSSNNPADHQLTVIPEGVFSLETVKIVYVSAEPYNPFHISNSLRAPPAISV